MIDSPLRRYYEENIQKGYTIEQITNNLRNSNYSEGDLQRAVSSLSPEYHELSRRNPSLFDYSSLPEDVRSSVAHPSDPASRKGNNNVNLQNSSAPQPDQNKPVPVSGQEDIHPGMDTQAKIKFGVVLGLIFMIVVLGSILLSTSSDQIDDNQSSLDDSGDTYSDDGVNDSSETYEPEEDVGANQTTDLGRDDLVAESAERGLDITSAECNDYDCLIQSSENCDVTALIPHKEIVRPFSVIYIQNYELFEHDDGCMMLYRLESYRRSYTSGERERLILDEEMDEEDIAAEEDEMWEDDSLHDPEAYSMLCRAQDISLFDDVFQAYADKEEPAISCPDEASMGMIFGTAAGIAIDPEDSSRSCSGDDAWDDLECVRIDPGMEMEDQFDNLNSSSDDVQDKNENEDSMDDFESNASDYRDTRGDSCEDDDDCFDGDVTTINYCDGGECKLKLDDGRECVSGDNFCPERCYGMNITDCKDPDGNTLCSSDEHCDDGDEYTEGLCRDGVCTYFDVEPPNEPPVIDSPPNLSAYHDERYESQVEAHDPDGSNLTFTLEDEPNGMTINESTGLIDWQPHIDSYSSGKFSLVVSDGVDETIEELLIMIYLKEEDDELYQDCGDDRSCYLQLIEFNDDYERCKYLSVYWDDTEDDVYDCIIDVASETGNESICEYVYDDDRNDECEASV
ncbi:MAG: Ig domain-containing protein [Candidatus Woesearchaeota archaeon]